MPVTPAKQAAIQILTGPVNGIDVALCTARALNSDTHMNKTI